MHDGKEFECLVAVGFNGTAILVEYPKDMVNWLLESDWMDEFDWKGIPDKAGLYKCKVTFWFDQGYIDGYPCDSENSWGFIITESEGWPHAIERALAADAEIVEYSNEELKQMVRSLTGGLDEAIETIHYLEKRLEQLHKLVKASKNFRKWMQDWWLPPQSWAKDEFLQALAEVEEGSNDNDEYK